MSSRRIEIDDDWRAKLRQRHISTIARSISAIERDPAFVLAVCQEIFPAPQGVASIGITGAPGAGKSTLVNRIIGQYRQRGKTVAVLAIDPSSVTTGGAVLGDRLRMQDHALDEDVFVRSLSTKGHLGGLSQSTFITAQLLKYAGFDRVLVETVGIGQNELDIVSVADLTTLVMIPGMGDHIQAIKSGIMEIGDVFALNKKDNPGIRTLQRIIGEELHHREHKTGKAVPMCATNAVDGDGVAELVDAFETLLAAEPDPQRLARLQSQLQAFSRSLLNAYIESGLKQPFFASEPYAQFAAADDGRLPVPSAIVDAFREFLHARTG